MSKRKTGKTPIVCVLYHSDRGDFPAEYSGCSHDFRTKRRKTDYSTFLTNVEEGNVTKAEVRDDFIYYAMEKRRRGSGMQDRTNG